MLLLVPVPVPVPPRSRPPSGTMSEGVDLIDIYADEEFNQVRGSPAAPGGEQGASPRHPNVPRGTPRQWERERERRGAERRRFGEGERPQGPALPVVPAGRELHEPGRSQHGKVRPEGLGHGAQKGFDRAGGFSELEVIRAAWPQVPARVRSCWSMPQVPGPRAVCYLLGAPRFLNSRAPKAEQSRRIPSSSQAAASHS